VPDLFRVHLVNNDAKLNVINVVNVSFSFESDICNRISVTKFCNRKTVTEFLFVYIKHRNKVNYVNKRSVPG
jgi:hypothetical protein